MAIVGNGRNAVGCTSVTAAALVSCCDCRLLFNVVVDAGADVITGDRNADDTSGDCCCC